MVTSVNFECDNLQFLVAMLQEQEDNKKQSAATLINKASLIYSDNGPEKKIISSSDPCGF